MTNFGKDSGPEQLIPKMSQETLAEIVGTTRSRISIFMNKFRKLGFVDYRGYDGRLEVHSSLLNVIMQGAACEEAKSSPFKKTEDHAQAYSSALSGAEALVGPSSPRWSSE
jgi:CRP/FNR family transcriptional regulator, cyclic AMP receptor protein